MSWPFPQESAHPLVVHFPIALLLTAVGLDLLALILKRQHLYGVALWNLALGTLGAGVAVWTGDQASDIAKHSFEIYQVMELHRKLGIATLILGSLAVVWRLWRRDQLGCWARRLALLMMLGMTGTLAYGAHLGGRLVYEFGVGGAFGRSDAASPHERRHHH